MTWFFSSLETVFPGFNKTSQGREMELDEKWISK